MTYETILLNTEGPIAFLTLNRPEAYNALSKLMRQELLDALKKVDENDTVRVCVINGAGKGFSAGNDLRDGAKYDHVSDLIVGEYLPALELIHNSDVLFLAQVHGSCAGIAAALAMTCDFVTMAEGSTVYMAFAAIALMPDGGATFHMMNAMGYRRALEAIIEGRHLPAGECLDLGIANRVYPADQLEAQTREWATSIAARAPLAVSATKRVMRGMVGRSFADTVKVEAEEQNALVNSKDFMRGIAGFETRKPPVFEGN